MLMTDQLPSPAPFRFPSAGVHLVGEFYAGGEGMLPTAMFIHGLPGHEKNRDIAQALQSRGWHAIVWSPRGAWGSDGDYTIAGIPADLAALLAFLRAEAWPIDWAHVALVGYSLGAASAVQFAHAHPPAAAALVLLAPVVDFLEGSPPLDYAAEMAEMLSGTTAAGLQRDWMQQAWSGNPVDLISDLHTPTLVVYGDADDRISGESLQAFVDAAAHAQLVLLPGADHHFAGQRQALAQAVATWLAETLPT